MTHSDDTRELVLASASPRRRELLAVLGVQYRVAPANIDETPRDGEPPGAYVQRMALEKARAGLLQAGPDALVLGADTTVAVDGDILGKPADRADAMRILGLLSGRTHQVYSAVALCDVDNCAGALSCTDVSFRKISTTEAVAYWNTGEPADKAGAYGIQGLGSVFVKAISGSYTGVVGLPLYETAELLTSAGFGPILAADTSP